MLKREDLNRDLLRAEYAVRGAIPTRALQLEAQGRKVIYCNPADLGGARGTALDVGRQSGGVGRLELVEQERIDQVAGARAVQGLVALRVRHIPYMT